MLTERNGGQAAWMALRIAGLLAAVLLAALTFGVQVARATPTVISVTAAGDATDSGGYCQTVPNTTCTLRDAIDLGNAPGNAGSTINVPTEVDTLSSSYGELRIVQPVTITGSGDSSNGTEIKQTAGDHDRVLEIYDASSNPVVGQVTISGVELTGGNLTSIPADVGTPLQGGGILIDPDTPGASVTLTDDLITGNSVTGATATGTGLLADGQTAEGGGIELTGQSPALTLDDSTVSSDTAESGAGADGGATRDGGTGGYAFGGGIEAGYGTLTVEDGSTFTADLAYSAAGGSGGTNASLYPPGNGGYAGGGGIDTSSAATLTLSDSTLIDDNAAGAETAPGPGGAAYGGALSLTGPATITADTFLADAATGGQPGTTYSAGYANGGALIIFGTGVNVAASTFDDDTVVGTQADGGAIDIDATGVTVVNSTITASGGEYAQAGGGIEADEATELASDTIADNSVKTGGTGANIYAAGGVTKLADTIVSNPSGAANCAEQSGQGSFADLTSPGYNMEDDAGSCGFSTAHGDLVNDSPQLAQLTDNGGPTQTMLPQSESLTISGGGACTDPSTTPASALLVDQRGDPRPSGGPCDIGAVQIGTPTNTVAPSVTPVNPTLGQQLTCAPGTWTTEDGISYTYTWLRNGTAISGATAATYTPVQADVDQQLACAVVGANAYSKHSSATSAAVIVTVPADATPPSGTTTTGAGGTAAGGGTTAPGAGAAAGGGATTGPGGTTTSGGAGTQSSAGGTRRLTGATQSTGRWRETGKAAKGKPPVGTRFVFVATAPGTVSLTFTTSAAGRKVNGRCVAMTHADRTRAKCTRTVTTGTLAVKATAGRNTLAFTGKLANGRKLAVGTYTVRFTLTGAAGSAKPVTLTFTVVK